MRTSIIVIDNFYNNVDDVRRFALSQSFNVEGNYPGNRTECFMNDSIKEIIQNALKHNGGNIKWDKHSEYTGAYQYTTKHDKSWIHADNGNNWAGVCYLTPNAPLNSGTGFF